MIHGKRIMKIIIIDIKSRNIETIIIIIIIIVAQKIYFTIIKKILKNIKIINLNIINNLIEIILIIIKKNILKKKSN